MEVCNLMVEKAPFGVCNDCYTSLVFGQNAIVVSIYIIITRLLHVGLFVC